MATFKCAIPIFTVPERQKEHFMERKYPALPITFKGDGEVDDRMIKPRNPNAVTQFNHPKRETYLVNVLGCQLYLVQAPYQLSFVAKILKQPDYLRIIYDRDGTDTYRHLVLLDEATAKLVRSEKWPRLFIRPYCIDIQRNLPRKNEMSSLYVRMPSSPNLDGNSRLDRSMHGEKRFLHERLNLYTHYNILPAASWRINSCPSGALIVHFDREVDTYRRAVIRILLDNEIWQDTKVRCSWQHL